MKRTDTNRKYPSIYRKMRKKLLESNPICYWCRLAPATTADHDPALSSFPSPELWQGILRPACAKCNYSRGAQITNARRNKRKWSRAW